MLALSIVIISFILDGILNNFLPFMVGDLSIFSPLLTLVSIMIIYPLYRKKEKKYFITIFIVGFIYDLFYTNLLFFNALLFLLIGFFVKQFFKYLEYNFINIFISTILIICLYEVTIAVIILIFNLVPITIFKLIYKIGHTLILNILYAEALYLILKLVPKKFKRVKIN